MAVALILEEDQQKQLDEIKQYLGMDTLDATLDKILKDYKASNRIPNQKTIDAIQDEEHEVVTLDEFRQML